MANKKLTASRSPTMPRHVPVWLALVVLAVAVWLVYGSTIDAPFIFDDQLSVEQNASIVRLWPLIGTAEHPGPLRTPIENPTSARPLVNLTLALNYYFGQLNPRGYHAVNFCLHIAASVLLWAIVRRTLRLPRFDHQFDAIAGKLALCVALLWSVHPLLTEAVVYVTQRTELMVAVFYLGAIYCSLRYWSANTSTSRRCWLLAATFAGLAGAASKEVMVSAPLVIFLYEGTFIRNSWREVLRGSWPLYLGLSMSWLLIGGLQWDSPRGTSTGFGLNYSLVDWWSTQAKVFVMYLRLAVYPWPLVLHYEFPIRPLADNLPYVFASAAIVLITLWLLWRRLTAGFVLAATLLILAPTHLVPIPMEMAAERRMYLPLAALIALAVIGLTTFSARSANRKLFIPLATAAAILIALVYAVASHNRLALYNVPTRLWQDAATHQPDNAVVQFNLARALTQDNRLDEAVEHYRLAAKHDPDSDQAHYGLGLALAHLGQLDESIQHLREVVRLKPQAYRLRNNLGVVLFTAGRYPEAIVEFEKTLQIQPDFTEARENLNRARQASVLPQRTQ